MNPETTFRYFGATHVGQKRKVNQDTFATIQIQHPNGTYHLLILADGMGGGMKGDVASQTAVATVSQFFASTPWYNPEEASREAVFAANRAVYDQGTGAGQATKSFMGTTLVFALVEAKTNRVWITNVGDSRAYLIREGAMEQVTRDHSLVAEHAREGSPLSPEEVARLKNVVTRAVGLESTVEPDVIGPMELGTDDRLLLCSDGLHGLVPDDRILRLAQGTRLEKAADTLISAANRAGGPDNITVVLGTLSQPEEPGRVISSRLIFITVVGGVGVALVLALVVSLALNQKSDRKGESPATGSSSTETPELATRSDEAQPTSGTADSFDSGQLSREFETITVKSGDNCSGLFTERASALPFSWAAQASIEALFGDAITMNGKPLQVRCALNADTTVTVPTRNWIAQQVPQ